MSASETDLQHQFGKIRGFLWPIYRGEIKKVLPMLFIFFLIAFNYNVLRTMKDTLVVYGKDSGAEVIPFLKFWFMFPGSLLMTFLFTRLSNRFRREHVVYLMTGGFLLYFTLFVLFLYPNRDFLHFDGLAQKLHTILPHGCRGFIAACCNWTFTLFYVMSELWSAVVLFMLMWGFVNQVTRLGEAKRFYAIFGVGINISGVVAGQVSIYMCDRQYDPHFIFGHTAWEQSMFALLALVIGSGVISLLLFRWLNRSVLTDQESCQVQEKEKEVVGKISMRDSFRLLAKSRYLIYISVIVFVYGCVINIAEVLWKHEVKSLYPDPNDYTLYMNYIVTIIGVIATLVSLFISGNFIRRLGWYFTAMLTPTILAITSVAFFGAFFMKECMPATMYAIWGVPPLALVVFLGSMQNILSRSAKYTVYDATREMAFIPLSLEEKVKGKAVIDGVFSRMGKSGAAILYQILLVVFATVSASMPVITVVLFGVIALWFRATHKLGVAFAELDHDAAASRPVESSAEQPA